LHLPLHALADQVVAADALIGAAADELHERLLEAPSREARFLIVERWLLARLRPREPAQALVMRALAQLGRAGDGSGSVAAACDQLGLSNKHLIDLFRRHVGMTPKAIARVGRFHRSLGALAAGASATAVAYRLGYADQAHFNHEFRRFA